jgi:hypothetical protein
MTAFAKLKAKARWTLASWILFGRRAFDKDTEKYRSGAAPILSQIACLDHTGQQLLARGIANIGLDLGLRLVREQSRAQNLRLLHAIARQMNLGVMVTDGLAAEDLPLLAELIDADRRLHASVLRQMDS